MRKALLVGLGMLGIVALGHDAKATSIFNVYVVSIQLVGTQYGVVTVNVSPGSARPACHNTNATYNGSYAFDISTNKGRAILSTVTAAKLSNLQLDINGANSCTNTGASPGQIESIDQVLLK